MDGELVHKIKGYIFQGRVCGTFPYLDENGKPDTSKPNFVNVQHEHGWVMHFRESELKAGPCPRLLSTRAVTQPTREGEHWLDPEVIARHWLEAPWGALCKRDADILCNAILSRSPMPQAGVTQPITGPGLHTCKLCGTTSSSVDDLQIV